MPAAVDIGSLIERSPEIRKGRPCIAGTGVTVRRIAGWYNLGLTPEEIAASIVGQIIAVFSGHPGGHLCVRAGPIHLQEKPCLMEQLCE